MKNIVDDVRQNILILLGTSKLSTQTLFCILVYIITNVPLNVSTLSRIKQLIKESEVN